MRVLVLGGSGGMGRYCFQPLLKLPSVESIVVADLNGPSAAAFVAILKDGRVSSLPLDVTNSTALSAALEKADVVLNFVGPFFRFGPLVLKAAIAARQAKITEREEAGDENKSKKTRDPAYEFKKQLNKRVVGLCKALKLAHPDFWSPPPMDMDDYLAMRSGRNPKKKKGLKSKCRLY